MQQTTMTDARTTGLQDALAQTFTLYLDTHIAHWNIRGPNFPHLHAMFEEQYTELWNALDTIAERIRALGADVERDAITGGPTLDGHKESKTVPALAKAHRKISAQLADLEQAATEAGDVATADLAVGRMRAHDQFAWMLEAISEA